MKILITGAGGAAAISVWKSLNDTHELYMADMDPCAAGLYLVPENRRLLLPHGNSTEFIPVLLHEAKKNNIELLIPTVDTELFSVAFNKEEFERYGIKIPLSSVSSLEMCRDKYALLNHCKSTGHTGNFQLLNSETKLKEEQFPCFAKPRKGAGSTGIHTIKSQADLDVLPKDNSYLIQELLPGNEYSVDVYIHSSGRPTAAVPRLRMKVDSGIAVAAQTHILPELTNMALEIAQMVGITYVANIQFKANTTGQFKLLEINPRFPGTLPLTAAAGVDIPKLLIKDIEGAAFEPGILPYKELMVVRYWTEHFCSIDEWASLCNN